MKSPSDPDAGFMKHTGKPLGFYYLSHQTCDARYGLITDVYTTPGNVLDSTVHSERIKRQIVTFGFRPEAVCGRCIRQLGDTQRHAGYGHTDIHT